MWRLLLGTMGVKSLVQGLNAAATAGFEPRTVWSEVRRRNRLATAPPLFKSFLPVRHDSVLLVSETPRHQVCLAPTVQQNTSKKGKEKTCRISDKDGKLVRSRDVSPERALRSPWEGETSLDLTNFPSLSDILSKTGNSLNRLSLNISTIFVGRRVQVSERKQPFGTNKYPSFRLDMTAIAIAWDKWSEAAKILLSWDHVCW